MLDKPKLIRERQSILIEIHGWKKVNKYQKEYCNNCKSLLYCFLLPFDIEGNPCSFYRADKVIQDNGRLATGRTEGRMERLL